MAEPFIIISTSAIKDGKLDEYKSFSRKMIKIIENNEPRLRAFGTYINEDGTKATTVQVHPDADSMVFHLQVVREKMDTAFEHIKLESMIACGKLNDQIVGMAEQIAETGVTVTLNPEALSGFTRPIQGQ